MVTDGWPEQIERLVDGRTARHQSLTTHGGPALWVVLDESALARNIGGSKVMKHQFAALDLTESGRARLQVVPFETEHHPGLSNAFNLFTAPEAGVVPYVGNQTPGCSHERG